MFSIVILTALAAPTRAEVRGTWLTTTGPDSIASGANTQATFTNLRNIGLNTAYVEAWKNGYSQFPSPTMQQLIGIDRAPSLGGRNLLEETTIHAHRNQMAHIAWLEFGFSSQFVGSGGTPSNPLSQWALANGYLLQDRNGNYANNSNGFAWMNPAIPEVRQLLIDVTLDAINANDLDGVQLDDRLAWPREFGWDPTTAALYLAETGRNLPTGLNDSNFRNWRAQKTFEFATEWYTAVKTARPDLIVSVSPSIMTFSFTQYNADWEDWADAGLFDEIVPQVYRNTLSAYRSTLPTQVNIMAGADATPNGRLEDLVVGISRDSSSTPTSPADLLQMIQDARNAGTAGHVLWYSRGVLEVASELTAFYDQNPELDNSPKIDPNRRPAPIVATENTVLPALWQFTITTPGQYRFVTRVNSTWSEDSSAYLLPGDYQFQLSFDIDQVELLADRRPIPADFNSDWLVNQLDINALTANFGTNNPTFDLNEDGSVNPDDLLHLVQEVWNTRQGDANLDGSIDLVDLSILAANFNQPIPTAGGWTNADFNASGTIDLIDLSLLAANFGFQRPLAPTTFPTPALPEPAAATLMLLTAALGSRPLSRYPA
ncbi:MAG: family 10 glycosylhydrolase [Phycisphaeraceae bacterium]